MRSSRHQTPFRWKTRPSWREKVLGSSRFLSPILASESDLILLVLPRDSTFPASSPVPMSTSSSSSARLPNLAVMSPEAHAFDPSHPAHHACPSFCYRSLVNLSRLRHPYIHLLSWLFVFLCSIIVHASGDLHALHHATNP